MRDRDPQTPCKLPPTKHHMNKAQEYGWFYSGSRQPLGWPELPPGCPPPRPGVPSPAARSFVPTSSPPLPSPVATIRSHSRLVITLIKLITIDSSL